MMARLGPFFMLALMVVLAPGGEARAEQPAPSSRSAGSAPCRLRAATPALQQLCARLHELAATDPSTFAVAYIDLRDRQALYLRADEWMHAASTYKTAVMVGVFELIARRKLALDTQIPITNRFRSIVDGSRYRVPVPRRHRDTIPDFIGQTLPVSRLVEEMITISSNLATNTLLERVGPKQVMRTLRKVGVRGIKVLRGVEDIKAFDRGLSNETTARGLARLYEGLARGKVISPRASKQMVQVLLRQKLGTKLRPYLPKSIKLAHKGGTISKVSHDGGIAYRKGRAEYVLVLMSRGYRRLAHVDRVLARMSRAIYLHVAQKRGFGRKRKGRKRPSPLPRRKAGRKQGR